ncbi:hypothetical protein BGZ96_004854 [Linnemannia gamsii]|uniref:Uncharacterized protein n=1 Tax=Linnemannia gamsii TaxID=64522 RepID=A0ABQ7JHS1_9FUNG|nr:hypothetical protein BGZ96_004854 [Linnemannia gamsii]
MALEILQECIHLEVFETDCIALKGLRLIIDKPWACLGLTRLRATFESDPDDSEMDRIVFEQLARLTRLREFDMSRLTVNDAEMDDTNQEVTMEDAEWMLEHWPLLKKLKGQLTSDARTEDLLAGMLRDRGVVCEKHLKLYLYQPEHEYEDLDALFSTGD